MGEARQKYRVRNANERGERRKGVERCPLVPSRFASKSIIRIRGQSAKKYTRCYNFKRTPHWSFLMTATLPRYLLHKAAISPLFPTGQILFPRGKDRSKNLLLDDSSILSSFNRATNVEKRNESSHRNLNFEKIRFEVVEKSEYLFNFRSIYTREIWQYKLDHRRRILSCEYAWKNKVFDTLIGALRKLSSVESVRDTIIDILKGLDIFDRIGKLERRRFSLSFLKTRPIFYFYFSAVVDFSFLSFSFFPPSP